MPIPQVDIGSVSICIPDEQLKQEDLVSVAKLVKNAFTQWGFVYLVGHGIPSAMISDIFQISKEFFQLPIRVKEKHKRGLLGHETNSGYTMIGMETLDPKAPFDVKEAFDYGLEVKDEPKELWPEELPKFEVEMKRFFYTCVTLTNRILHIIGIAMNLDDPLYFVKAHKCLGKFGSSTALRTLYYPPIETAAEIKPGQLRCSEHSDYGSITLLLQDDAGGLMVKTTSGNYIPAVPVKDAVLVNIADLMQRWTNDELISVTLQKGSCKQERSKVAAQHKVIIPEEEVYQRRPRQSIAFFVQPDDACDIVCINGSNKYPVVNSKDYLWSRFRDTYK